MMNEEKVSIDELTESEFDTVGASGALSEFQDPGEEFEVPEDNLTAAELDPNPQAYEVVTSKFVKWDTVGIGAGVSGIYRGTVKNTNYPEQSLVVMQLKNATLIKLPCPVMLQGELINFKVGSEIRIIFEGKFKKKTNPSQTYNRFSVAVVKRAN